jgi:GGDEF domain-containing protein
MSKANAISFTPAGLTALPKLVEVTDRVRELLDNEIEQRSQEQDFGRYFEGDTLIRERIQALGAETDIEEFRDLSEVSIAEKKRLSEIEAEIAALKLQDTSETIARLKQTKADLNDLIGRLEETASGLSDAKLEEFASALDELVRWQASVKQLGSDEFAVVEADYVGSDPWFKFIQAAKSLAEFIPQ